MTFHEKLSKLTEDRKKTVVARRAGLPSTAINQYLYKKQVPACDIALRIARALNVSVDWLIDDQQDWPPVFASRPQSATAA